MNVSLSVRVVEPQLVPVRPGECGCETARFRAEATVTNNGAEGVAVSQHMLEFELYDEQGQRIHNLCDRRDPKVLDARLLQPGQSTDFIPVECYLSGMVPEADRPYRLACKGFETVAHTCLKF